MFQRPEGRARAGAGPYKEKVKLPPWVGVAAIVVGGALLAIGKKCRAAASGARSRTRAVPGT